MWRLALASTVYVLTFSILQHTKHMALVLLTCFLAGGHYLYIYIFVFRLTAQVLGHFFFFFAQVTLHSFFSSPLPSIWLCFSLVVVRFICRLFVFHLGIFPKSLVDLICWFLVYVYARKKLAQRNMAPLASPVTSSQPPLAPPCLYPPFVSDQYH